MEHRGFHLFVSPLGKLIFWLGRDVRLCQIGQQGSCQAHNKLIFLTFSAFRQVGFDPHRSKFDGIFVPRRNTSRRTTEDNDERGEIWNFGYLIYDPQNRGRANKPETGGDHEEIAEHQFREER
jgi:hypothetical protein